VLESTRKGEVNCMAKIQYRAIIPEEIEYVRELYETSFPDSEKKPFDAIVRIDREDKGNMYTILKGEEAVGLLFTLENDELTLIDYFAIDPNAQNGQVGSKVLRTFFEEEEKPIVLEIENPEKAEDAEEEFIRKKREAFYLRNGLKIMPYRVDLFGVEMKILTYGETISFEQYLKVLQDTLFEGVEKYVKEVK
jgi:hypothetical protein